MEHKPSRSWEVAPVTLYSYMNHILCPGYEPCFITSDRRTSICLCSTGTCLLCRFDTVRHATFSLFGRFVLFQSQSRWTVDDRRTGRWT
jgi:hypothetical protein